MFAVPGSPLDPRAKGANDLIRQGATLCEGAEDVLRVVQSLRFDHGPVREPDWDFLGPPSDDPAIDAAADALRARLEGLLSPTPISRDELVRAMGAPAPAVLAALVELSLAGRASLLPGGLAARAFPDE